MAESSSLRSGQFVIRSRPAWQRRLLTIGSLVGSVLLLYAAYETGRFQGGYSKFAEIQRRRELNAQIDTLTESNEKLKAELASAELARTVDKQAYADVVGWAGKGPYADALVDIWRAIREGRLATVSDGVKQVTGRKPIPFPRWAEENADAFQ